MADNGKPTVFYDGGCNLCRREIAYYQRLDRARRVHWVDITRDGSALQPYGLSYEQAMERFHVVTATGEIVTGAYAFAYLWTALPYWWIMAKLLTGLHLLPWLDKVYDIFARRRLQRRCAGGACQYPSSVRRQ